MAYITLPTPERTKTGLEAFTEGASPYLQQAFMMMMQRKFQEQQHQRNIEQSQQMFPEAFTQPSYEELARQRGMPIQGLQYPQALPQDQREAFYKDIYTRKFGAEIPAKYKKFSLQKAQQYPGFGIDFTTGGMEYKVPQPLAPTYLYNPSTGQVEPMVLPTGEPISPKAKIVTQPETPKEKQQREVETAQQKKAGEIKAETQAVDNMASAVWNASDRLIPAPEKPAEAETLGMQRRLKTADIFGWRPQRQMGISDENALAFDQVKRGEATPLIRALGEKGMLTNQDIERAYNLMPHFSDTQKLRNTKKEELKKFLKARINAYYQTGETLQQPQEDFSTMSDEELRRIAGGG